MYTELELYSGWIHESLQGIRKREAKALNYINPLVLAYKATNVLQSSLIAHKTLVATCCSIGKLITLEYVAKDTTITSRDKEGNDIHHVFILKDEKDNDVVFGPEDGNIEKYRELFYFKNGYHLLNALFNNGKLKITRGKYNRDPYTVTTVGDFVDKMIYSINANPMEAIPVYNKPLLTAPEPFTEFNHPIAGVLVRHANKSAEEYFNYDNCPKVFDVINKIMATPYRVNDGVLNVLQQCQDDPIFTLKDKGLTNEQKTGMKREMTNVLSIASGVVGRPFWRCGYYDNRGRAYDALVYFSTQGSKLSKSLITFNEPKKLGKQGWFWLMVHAAGVYGKDKLTLDERFEFAVSKLTEWMEIASNPVANKLWQIPKEKYLFLAAILELKKALDSGDKYSYESNLIISWDATCSGLQILSALSRDRKSGELCNITKNHERNDYYGMIGSKATPYLKYDEQELKMFHSITEDLTRLNADVNNARSRESAKAAGLARREYSDSHRSNIWDASKAFWGRPEILEYIRDIAKRPGMTYFYSCGARTMAKSLYKDWGKEDEFKGIQRTFCLYLASRFYSICKTEMPGPTAVMDLLIEMGLADYKKRHRFLYEDEPMSVSTMAKRIAIELIIKDGKHDEYNELSLKEKPKMRSKYSSVKQVEEMIAAEDVRFTLNPEYVEGGVDFTIIAPYTRFKLVHPYRDNLMDRVKVYYKGKDIKVKVCVGKGNKVDYQKVSNATSPNIVHMLDSQVVAHVLYNTDYPVNCIHDSFGTRAAEAGALYEDTRKSFVALFSEDVLTELLEQKGMKNPIEYGDLDINEALDNPFIFH